MTISTDGQLTEHIKELNSRCDIINWEICAIGAKTQLEKEEVRVKFKLFETYLMPALLYGMKAGKDTKIQDTKTLYLIRKLSHKITVVKPHIFYRIFYIIYDT